MVTAQQHRFYRYMKTVAQKMWNTALTAVTRNAPVVALTTWSIITRPITTATLAFIRELHGRLSVVVIAYISTVLMMAGAVTRSAKYSNVNICAVSHVRTPCRA